MLGVVGFAYALNVYPIIRSKLVGMTEPEGLVCTITLGDRWDNYDWKLEMDALPRRGIWCDYLLGVLAQQVVAWVAPWVAPLEGAACVRHEYGGPPAVLAWQVADPAPLELVDVLCLKVFHPWNWGLHPWR